MVECCNPTCQSPADVQCLQLINRSITCTSEEFPEYCKTGTQIMDLGQDVYKVTVILYF